MSERKSTSRHQGLVVELVRLILVAVFAAGGWRIARALDGRGSSRLIVGIALGSMVGYVAGGILGRRTAAAVTDAEQEFRRVPASELLAGVLGLILGLVVAALTSVLLFRLPIVAAAPTTAFVALALSALGYRVGRARHEELFGLFGLKPRASGSRRGEVNILDTSAIIDGRVLDVVRSGFLGGSLLVHRGVLDELHRIADSSDPKRRARGQRGLEILKELQRMPQIDVVLIEEQASSDDVDTELVRLARDRGGVLVTTDANLATVAETLDVPVRSLNQLAAALRPPVLPGEEVLVLISKEGREHGQGVGYLEDGTMVVVEGAADRLGAQERVQVTNVLQTHTGTMIFGRLGDE
ncbi:MAG: PIN/TRAM domain-containing protein [Actinomycetota bacterium]